MIVGILSDSHDRLPALAAGVKTLLANGAMFLIHCGDVGSPAALQILAQAPAAFVFGKTDYDRQSLIDEAKNLNLQCLGTGGELTFAEQKIFVTHGDNGALVQRVITEQSHDYLLVGHTHVALDQRDGRVRIINPGALHRTARKTVALLNLEADRLTYLQVTA